jgi:hypothetical protein
MAIGRRCKPGTGEARFAMTAAAWLQVAKALLAAGTAVLLEKLTHRQAMESRV